MMVWQWLSSFEALGVQRAIWLFPFVLGNNGVTISQFTFLVMAVKKGKKSVTLLSNILGLSSAKPPCSLFSSTMCGLPGGVAEPPGEMVPGFGFGCSLGLTV